MAILQPLIYLCCDIDDACLNYSRYHGWPTLCAQAIAACICFWRAITLTIHGITDELFYKAYALVFDMRAYIII
jgi:hypothetical protein